MSRRTHLGVRTQICPRNTVGVPFSDIRLPQLDPALPGDVICLRILSEVVVVVCSVSALKDLFERRAVTYSDRPFLPIAEMYVL